MAEQQRLLWHNREKQSDKQKEKQRDGVTEKQSGKQYGEKQKLLSVSTPNHIKYDIQMSEIKHDTPLKVINHYSRATEVRRSINNENHRINQSGREAIIQESHRLVLIA